MNGCAYAACRQLGRYHSDGWNFCRRHMAEHMLDTYGVEWSPPARAAVAECGTEAGYSRHRRLGEPTCPPCKGAQNAANSARRTRRRSAVSLYQEAS